MLCNPLFLFCFLSIPIFHSSIYAKYGIPRIAHVFWANTYCGRRIRVIQITNHTIKIIYGTNGSVCMRQFLQGRAELSALASVMRENQSTTSAPFCTETVSVVFGAMSPLTMRFASSVSTVCCKYRRSGLAPYCGS